MKKILKYEIQFLTPCFCGGAEPKETAEVRAPSIRGQLRWWFRTLGGFNCLGDMSLREQEDFLFGCARKDRTQAGIIQLKIDNVPTVVEVNSYHELVNFSPLLNDVNYILFPFRGINIISFIKENESFNLILKINVKKEMVDKNMIDSIKGLLSIWIQLGGIGSRSRRCLGSLYSQDNVYSITDSLKYFQYPKNIAIFKLKPQYNNLEINKVVKDLIEWLSNWRHHGQMYRRWDKKQKSWIPISEKQKNCNRNKPGFRYARRDHNEGFAILSHRLNNDNEHPFGKEEETFRPALGLPIIQFFSSYKRDRHQSTVNWNAEYNECEDKLEGRFASPILLRPYKDKEGRLHPLVIFVDSHKWPDNHKVYLQGPDKRIKDLDVNLELYNAMKNDSSLCVFRD